MMRIVFGLILLGMLAACSPAPTVTDLPFYTATPALSGTPEGGIASLFGGTSLPEGFLSGAPQSLAFPGNFRFALNGAFSANIQSGTVIATTAAAYATTPERLRIVVSGSDEFASHQLSFEWNPALISGVYEIVSPGTFASSEVTAQYTRLNNDNTEDSGIQAFSEAVNGSITLTIATDTISGLFQFSAQRTLTSDQGEVETQTIQVSGEFSEVVLISADDPFENAVPLPTRLFVGTEEP
jgi:hypothetical protein